MLNKLTAGIVAGLKNVLTIILLFFLVVAVAKWARANPEQWQVVLNGVAKAAVAIITWITNWISSTLGSS